MAGFKYIDENLCCDGISIEEICNERETPFYLYSYGEFKERMNRFQEAFSGIKSLICYALKANSNSALLSVVQREGMGADVVSGGELHRALQAGIPPEKIVFAGVGKTRKEIELAMNSEIMALNVESFPELKLILKIAEEKDCVAPISLRVNPNIDPRTHPYISTGMQENKFGIDLSRAKEAYRIVKRNDLLEPVGIHAHIGSQITEARPFKDALSKVVEFTEDLVSDGIELDFMDIGGGLGIKYKDDDSFVSVEKYAEVIKLEIGDLSYDPLLIIEPGRSIIGPAGVLVTEIIYVKEKNRKIFFVVDAGMNDFIRPSLYEAWHEIVPLKNLDDRGKVTADIVGPVCESGDFFAKERTMPVVKAGEKLAIMDAGAYGFSMASNYNSRVKPQEILIKDNESFLIRDREKLEDLTKEENIPDFLK